MLRLVPDALGRESCLRSTAIVAAICSRNTDSSGGTGFPAAASEVTPRSGSSYSRTSGVKVARSFSSTACSPTYSAGVRLPRELWGRTRL